MDIRVIGQISALRNMTVAELRDEWERLYGEPSRSRNRGFLWRRLAWRVQELAYGGLSKRAKTRLSELAPETFHRARTPTARAASDPVVNSGTARLRSGVRDPRLPSPGSVIVKTYKGKELRVTVLDDGVEFEGVRYNSLTELAKAVTGCRSINGRLFFGLSKRKRG